MTRTNNAYLIEVEGIPIHVTRKAVHNVNLRVHDDGSVHMSVPWRVSRNQAAEVARLRIGWIRDAVRATKARQHANEHLWRTGETLRIWGEPVPVVVKTTDGRERAAMEDGRLVLCVSPSHSGDGETAREVRGQLVEGLLRNEAAAELARLLPACEQRVGRRASSVTLRRMKTRWGSCTPAKATIRLNTALAEQPRPCMEMVLVHELCHLFERNHGPRFQALMDRFSPGWRTWQHYLDEHPPRV